MTMKKMMMEGPGSKFLSDGGKNGFFAEVFAAQIVICESPDIE